MEEVPAQVVPAPAAQSLAPFIATPKHFSFLLAACAGTAARAPSREAARTRSRDSFALFILKAPEECTGVVAPNHRYAPDAPLLHAVCQRTGQNPKTLCPSQSLATLPP